MTEKPAVAVLAGGLSHERDISLRSGRRVAQALRDQGHEVIESDVDGSLVELFSSRDDLVAFPLLHGESGEDGALRALLAMLGVPFVGAEAASCRLCFDKSIATTLVRRAGIRTPRQVALPHDLFRETGASYVVDTLGESLGFPLMVKPARCGSALGCTLVESPAELPGAMVTAYGYGPLAVIESAISGTEVTVGVVDTGDGPVAQPVVAIAPSSGVYDYEARYTAGATRFTVPADLPDAVTQECQDIALRVHELFGLRDISRTDIIIDETGPVFIETNVAPGMTETSLLPIALDTGAGPGFAEVCSQLVLAAARRSRPEEN